MLLGVAAILVVGGVFSLWSLFAARSDLVHARQQATTLKIAVQRGDQAGAESSLAALQASLSSADHRTHNILWGFASILPFVGDDAHAVRTVASVGNRLAQGPLEELVHGAHGRVVNRLVPRGGRMNIRAIKSIAPLLDRVHGELSPLAAELRSVPADHLNRWVEPAFSSLSERVLATDAAISAADRAVRVLPAMLGQDGLKRYLLLFENNAEVRATGGLPGAYALVEADAGHLSLTRQGAGADFPEFAAPVLRQSAAERQIYDDQVARYFLDTNFTPEFPRTAELVREMWRQHTGQRVDGVLSVDAVAMSYLLGATGPLSVPDGIVLTRANATRELLNRTYFRLSDPDAQNAFFTEVARRLFDRVVGGIKVPAGFFSALGQGVVEGRLYVHDFHRAVQRELSGSSVSGELFAGDPRAPQVGLYLNDATGSKMSYYLRTKARLTAESCDDDAQQLEGVADLTYTADSPPTKRLPDYITGAGVSGTPPGEQLVLVRVYGPKDGGLSGFRVAGATTTPDVVLDRGRPVATVAVQLRRGQTVRVSWRVRSGAHQDRPATLTVTPGMLPSKAVQTVPSSCD